MSNGILGSCNVLLSYSKDEDVRLKSFCVQVSRRQDLKFFLHFQDPKSLAGLPANLVSLMSKGQLGATKLTEVSKPKIDTETPAQKQAAAKLALRKQLEKTLLQVWHGNIVSKIRKLIFFRITDSSAKASPTRDALYSQPCQYGIHLFDGFGRVC